MLFRRVSQLLQTFSGGGPSTTRRMSIPGNTFRNEDCFREGGRDEEMFYSCCCFTPDTARWNPSITTLQKCKNKCRSVFAADIGRTHGMVPNSDDLCWEVVFKILYKLGEISSQQFNGKFELTVTHHGNSKLTTSHSNAFDSCWKLSAQIAREKTKQTCQFQQFPRDALPAQVSLIFRVKINKITLLQSRTC